jgi:hypothetical protein
MQIVINADIEDLDLSVYSFIFPGKVLLAACICYFVFIVNLA